MPKNTKTAAKTPPPATTTVPTPVTKAVNICISINF